MKHERVYGKTRYQMSNVLSRIDVENVVRALSPDCLPELFQPCPRKGIKIEIGKNIELSVVAHITLLRRGWNRIPGYRSLQLSPKGLVENRRYEGIELG